MMKPVLTTLFLLLTLSCFSQRPVLQLAYYFKNDGNMVKSVDAWDFARIISDPDSGSKLFNVKEIYRNGKIKFFGKTSRVWPLVLQEQAAYFYPNGNRRLIATYKSNQLIGSFYEYYPNGKKYLEKEYIEKKTKANDYPDQDSLIKSAFDTSGKQLVVNGSGYFYRYDPNYKVITEEGPVKDGKLSGAWKGTDPVRKIKFSEEYVNGNLVKGVATDSLNQSKTYTSIRVKQPYFPGGIEGFYRYLGKSIRYPAYARENNIQGRVMVSFIVNEEGKTTDVKIVRSVQRDIDNETIRIIKLSPPWLTGIAYGKTETMRLTLPVNYELADW